MAAICRTAGQYQPDVIGITSTSPIFHNARLVASQLVKILHVPIVIGGAHVTVLPQAALEECSDFDFGVYGEGEVTFVELLEAIEGRRPFDTVAGLIWRYRGHIEINSARPYIQDLDTIPFPDRSLLDLGLYSWGVPGSSAYAA